MNNADSPHSVSKDSVEADSLVEAQDGIQNSSQSEGQDTEALIERGQGIVKTIAQNVHRSLPIRIDLEDLISYGQIGLAEAASRFDPNGNTQFTSFAYQRIRGAIYDGVSKMSWTSRARIRRQRFRQMADDVIDQSHQDHPETGSAKDDAAWLAGTTSQLAVVFLATGGDDETEDRLGNAADFRDPPSKVIADREMQTLLRDHVEQLDMDGRRLIQMIYFEGYTLTEAAERTGVSKSWASRLHAKSLEKMAKLLNKSGSDSLLR